MGSYAVHVDFQLPNNNACVEYHLDAIECDDAAILIAIAKVEKIPPNGKQNNFEFGATHLLPKESVVKKRLLHAKQTSG